MTTPPESFATGLKFQTGWQNINTFLMWMQRFMKDAKSSAIQPILVNCSSHVDFSVINFAKEHHITLQVFHHTVHIGYSP